MVDKWGLGTRMGRGMVAVMHVCAYNICSQGKDQGLGFHGIAKIDGVHVRWGTTRHGDGSGTLPRMRVGQGNNITRVGWENGGGGSFR